MILALTTGRGEHLRHEIAEAVMIVESMGWADTDSWQIKGGYSSHVSKRLMALLEKHIMNLEK